MALHVIFPVKGFCYWSETPRPCLARSHPIELWHQCTDEVVCGPQFSQSAIKIFDWAEIQTRVSQLRCRHSNHSFSRSFPTFFIHKSFSVGFRHLDEISKQYTKVVICVLPFPSSYVIKLFCFFFLHSPLHFLYRVYHEFGNTNLFVYHLDLCKRINLAL